MSSLINHQIIPGTRRLSECLEFCSIGRLFKYIGHRIKNLLILLDFCSIYDINEADDLCSKISLLIGTNTVFGITMDAKSTLVFNTLAMRWFTSSFLNTEKHPFSHQSHSFHEFNKSPEESESFYSVTNVSARPSNVKIALIL